MSASDVPTLVSIPRPPRVPTGTNWRHVEAIRYDLEHASVGAAYYSSQRERPIQNTSGEYADLSRSESDALCEARCALIDAAERLGRR